jgi:hypothetical protein
MLGFDSLTSVTKDNILNSKRDSKSTSSSSKRDSKASVVNAYCTYFLYLSIGMHTSIFIRSVGNPSVISFLIFLLLPGFG